MNKARDVRRVENNKQFLYSRQKISSPQLVSKERRRIKKGVACGGMNRACIPSCEWRAREIERVQLFRILRNVGRAASCKVDSPAGSPCYRSAGCRRGRRTSVLEFHWVSTPKCMPRYDVNYTPNGWKITAFAFHYWAPPSCFTGTHSKSDYYSFQITSATQLQIERSGQIFYNILPL